MEHDSVHLSVVYHLLGQSVTATCGVHLSVVYHLLGQSVKLTCGVHLSVVYHLLGQSVTWNMTVFICLLCIICWVSL